ncbi:MAG: UvrD-helicase domain-containing protein [Alkalispirochaeta sp.]
MVLDRDQQRATDVRHNVVVSAGAGSGKTRVLAERYLAIIREGSAGVPEILALTFTRKAAAEMYSRIYVGLQEGAGTHPSFLRELRRFDEARIATIDSFCASILRDGAHRFGLPPVVTSDDAELARATRRQAMAFLVRHGDEIPLTDFIRKHEIDGTIEKLLAPLIVDHVGIVDTRTFTDDLEEQLGWLSRRRKEIEGEVDEIVSRIAEYDVGSPSGVEAKQGIGVRSGDYEALRIFLEVTGRNIGSKGDAPLLKEEMNRLLDKSRSRRSGLLADWLAIVRTGEREGELRRLYALLDELRRSVIDERRTTGLLSFRDIMDAAVRLLSEDLELRRVYAEQFRYIMIDEFQDNNAGQRDLLFLLADRSGTPGVPDAEEIDGTKLFFVGDQKQSIYRFRGADVSVFRRLADEIARSLPEDIRREALIELPRNYRSDPLLITFFNRLFPTVFASAEEDYEAEFSGLEVPEIERDENGAAGVTVAWVPNDRPESDDDVEYADGKYAEAGWIAGEIDHLVHREGYSPGDIAILLRSSAGQQVYERMLRRQGIPYHTGAVRSLFTEAPASDIYSLLQLIYYPDDREALVAYLRGPLVMLSDAGIVRVLTGDAAAGRDEAVGSDVAAGSDAPKGGDATAKVRASERGASDTEPQPRAPEAQRSLPPALAKPFPATLSTDDREKLVAAGDLYRDIASRLDRDPVYEVIRRIWDEGGYRYGILHRGSDHSYLEHLEYLFALALRFQGRSAIEFVDFLREQMGETEKQDELQDEGSDGAVQVMTIHKSKGLEFPIVFVADCDRRLTQRSDLIWHDDSYGVTVRLPESAPSGESYNVIESHAREEEDRRSLAELKRLLYVAATRAEKRLYFTAAMRSGNRGTSLFQLLSNALGLQPDTGGVDSGFNGLVTTATIPHMTEDELRGVAVPQGVRRRRVDAIVLLEGAGVPRRSRRIVESTPSGINAMKQHRDGWMFEDSVVDTADDPSVDSAFGTGTEGGDTDATTLGTLVHRLLELRITATTGDLSESEGDTAATTGAAGTPELTKDAWGPDHSDARSILWRIEDPEERVEMCRTSWELSERFLASEFWDQLRSPGEDRSVECEVPFYLRAGEPALYLNGKIDLVVEGSDRVEIVDFKSDLEVVPEHYEMQMAVYRRAAEELYGKPGTVHLFYLRTGEAVRIDADLNTLLPEIDLSEVYDDGVSFVS